MKPGPVFDAIGIASLQSIGHGFPKTVFTLLGTTLPRYPIKAF